MLKRPKKNQDAHSNLKDFISSVRGVGSIGLCCGESWNEKKLGGN